MQAIGAKKTVIDKMRERKQTTDREGKSIEEAIELLEKTPGLESAIRFVCAEHVGNF